MTFHYIYSGGSKDINCAVPTWQIEDITQEKSYWGPMTGSEAELKLRLHGGNCYLTRYSEMKQHYVISVSVMRRKKQQARRQRDCLELYNFKLNVTKENSHNEFEIEGTDNKFNSVSSLLEFFQKNPISHSVSSIGEPCIKKWAVTIVVTTTKLYYCVIVLWEWSKGFCCAILAIQSYWEYFNSCCSCRIGVSTTMAYTINKTRSMIPCMHGCL